MNPSDLARRHELDPSDEEAACALVDLLVRRGLPDEAASVARRTCAETARTVSAALRSRLLALPASPVDQWRLLADLDAPLDAGRVSGASWTGTADEPTLMLGLSDGALLRWSPFRGDELRRDRGPGLPRGRRGRHRQRFELIGAEGESFGFRKLPGSYTARWPDRDLEAEVVGALCMAPDHAGGWVFGTLEGTVVHLVPHAGRVDRRVHQLDGGDSIWAVGVGPGGELTSARDLGGLVVTSGIARTERVHAEMDGALMRSGVRVSADGATATALARGAEADERVVRSYRWREGTWTDTAFVLDGLDAWSVSANHAMACAWTRDGAVRSIDLLAGGASAFALDAAAGSLVHAHPSPRGKFMAVVTVDRVLLFG